MHCGKASKWKHQQMKENSRQYQATDDRKDLYYAIV